MFCLVCRSASTYKLETISIHYAAIKQISATIDQTVRVLSQWCFKQMRTKRLVSKDVTEYRRTDYFAASSRAFIGPIHFVSFKIS